MYGGQHDALCVGDTFATPADNMTFIFYSAQGQSTKQLDLYAMLGVIVSPPGHIWWKATIMN